jgi:hypothetical protein
VINYCSDQLGCAPSNWEFLTSRARNLLQLPCVIAAMTFRMAQSPDRDGSEFSTAVDRLPQYIRAVRAHDPYALRADPWIFNFDKRVRSIFSSSCSNVHWAGFLSGRHLRMEVPWRNLPLVK